MRRIHEVVAGVEVSAVLEGRSPAAGLRKDAQRRGLAEPDTESDVEDLDEDSPDVQANPLVEYPYQKLAVLLSGDGAARHGISIGCSSSAQGLHDRYELDHLRPHLVPQEAVDIEAVPRVGRVDRGQHVELDPVFLEQPDPLNDPVEGRSA